MVDPLQHVRVGQPIDPVTAETWNRFVDAARAHRGRSAGNLGVRNDPNLITPAATVLVRNGTGSNLSNVGSVLAITGVEYSPEDLPGEFRSYPVFTGAAPASSSDPIAILAEPAPSSQLGRGTVAGIAVVDILINDSSHQWAAPIAGDTAKLGSATSGPARILWKAGSSGVQRCVANLLDGQGAAGPPGTFPESHDYAYDNGFLDVDTDDTWTTLGEWSLPSAAGTYFITFEFSIELEVSAGEGVVWMRLYNNTQSVAAAYMAVLGGGAESDGGRFALDTEQLDTPLRQRVSTTYIVTIDEGDELLFQVKRLSGATYTTCRVAELGYDGAAFSAIKIA